MLQISKMVPLGIFPIILVFGLILPTEVGSDDNWGQGVPVWMSDFKNALLFDSPDCKTEGVECKTGECCHMFACRYDQYNVPRCTNIQLNVWFPDSLMRKIKFKPCAEEGQDCEDDLCCPDTNCYSLRDFTKRCMTYNKKLPDDPGCLKEGENCTTGACCRKYACLSHENGNSTCRVARPIEGPPAPTTTPEPEYNGKCLEEFRHCVPGQCCINMICHTKTDIEANRICKRATIYGEYRYFHTPE